MNWNDTLLEKFEKVEAFHWWWEGRRELIKFLMPEKNSLRILEVGCGTGETLAYIKKIRAKAEVFGVDFDPSAVIFSKKRGMAQVLKADAARLPFKNKTFDVVLFLDVLEHIQEQEQVIQESRRVLKEGGRIIITSPALPFIWSDHDTNQGHKRRYYLPEMKQLAKKTNMRLEFSGYFNFWFSLPIILIRVLSRFKPLSRLSSYDSGLNYDIAHRKKINNILQAIFVSEIKLLKYVRYPLGISVAAVFVRPTGNHH